jgi:peptidoglycan/xylan/chitin deacetylase (PgdA/CDA1 family)
VRLVPRGVKDAWEVPRDLALRRYPPFVTGGALPRGDVPVFVFHGAEPESFGRRIDHLARNGYVTLSIGEYVAVLRGTREAPERAVLLTFDDGRGSIWSAAAPILQRHGMKAVVFLVPGRMRSRPGPPAPTWGDVLAGLTSGAEVARGEEGDFALLSWEEVEALAGSGLFDFQSHTLQHARIHTGPRLVGFATPVSRRGYDAFDVPLVRSRGRDLLGDEVPLGTPLFQSAPRTSEALRFLEDESVRDACFDTVAAGGGEGFFARSDWSARLRAAVRRTAVRGTIESPDDRSQAIARELLESRRIIEARIGRPVVHLCYPWHAAGPTARRLAVEAGYETAFCGKVEGVPITRPGGDPTAIARIGEDYVELLPGRGRVTLAEVLRRKWARRFGGGVR